MPKARPLSSGFVLAGHAAAFLLLPIHYLVHRVYPADPAPPILALSPAELDFEYVKHGLQTWPLRSSLLYGALVLGVAWHAAEGAQIVWNTYLRGRLGGWKASVRSRAVGAALVALPVLSGVWAMWREPLMALTSNVARYQAAYTKSWIFRV